jgi:hypothetical protein
MGLPFCAPRLRFLSEDRRVDAILDRAEGLEGAGPRAGPLPLLVALARSGLDDLALPSIMPPRTDSHSAADRDNLARDVDEPLPVETEELLSAVVGWAAPYGSLAELRAAIDRHRLRVAELRRDDAPLTLATAHSTKGLEFDHVAVIGLDAGRFPSGRSLRDAPEPARALEEERRLAYVAWTRARRSLTLVYDPASPSQFLREAFSDAELGIDHDPP